MNDLKYLLTILIAISSCLLKGQSFELSGLFTTHDRYDFKNSLGYDIGFNFKDFNKNRISIHFSHVENKIFYDDIKIDESSAGHQNPEYYFDRISADNQKLSFNVSYGRNAIKRENSKLIVGADLSINYFKFYKETSRTHYRPSPDNYIGQSEFSSSYNKSNKIGLDFYIEFENETVAIKGLGLFSRLNFGLITYGRFYQLDGGWRDPWLSKWLTINLGLRYDFKSK